MNPVGRTTSSTPNQRERESVPVWRQNQLVVTFSLASFNHIFEVFKNRTLLACMVLQYEMRLRRKKEIWWGSLPYMGPVARK